MFTISQIKNKIKPLRPNLFYAELYLPSAVQTAFSSGTATGSLAANSSWRRKLKTTTINDTFKFRCEATEFPGRTIATSDDISFGPTTRFAYDTTYADLNLNIIASEDMIERAVFEYWMENLVINSSSNSKGGLVRYYDGYSNGKIVVNQVTDQNTIAAKCTLYGAFPIGIGPLNLTWEEMDSYQRFSVTIGYRYHIVDFPNTQAVTS